MSFISQWLGATTRTATKILDEAGAGSRVVVKSGDNVIGSVTAGSRGRMPYPPLSNQRGVIPALQLRRETGDGSASLLHATKAANDELSKIVSKGSDILKPASKSSSSTLKQSIKIGSIAAGAAGVTYPWC